MQSSDLTRLRMSKVKQGDTKPELIVRKLLWSLGYRYRLHLRGLPGKPDLAFIKNKKVIFIHGCFWHRHRCKAGQSFPSSNQAFWMRKFSKTIQRDINNISKLIEAGWETLVIWECETRDIENLKRIIHRFLES